MTDTNHSPVTLPPGGFDYDDLKAGLDKAAKGAKGKYAENVDKALDDAGDIPFKASDSRHIAGFRFEEVKREDLGITENVQVFDPKLAEKEGDVGEVDPNKLNQQAAAVSGAVAVAAEGEK